MNTFKIQSPSQGPCLINLLKTVAFITALYHNFIFIISCRDDMSMLIPCCFHWHISFSRARTSSTLWESSAPIQDTQDRSSGWHLAGGCTGRFISTPSWDKTSAQSLMSSRCPIKRHLVASDTVYLRKFCWTRQKTSSTVKGEEKSSDMLTILLRH